MACGTIADNDLQGNDGNLLDEGFPVAQFFYKMGGMPSRSNTCIR